MSKTIWAAAGAGTGAGAEPEVLDEDKMRTLLVVSLARVGETLGVAQSSMETERTSENFKALNDALKLILSAHKAGRGAFYGFFNLLDFSLKPKCVEGGVKNKRTGETEKRLGYKYVVDKFTHSSATKKWDRSQVYITVWDDATGLCVPQADFDGYHHVFYHGSIMSAFYESLRPLLDLPLKNHLPYVSAYKREPNVFLSVDDCTSPDGDPENTRFFRLIEEDKAEIICNMTEGPDCFLSNLQKLINRLPFGLRGNSIFIPTEMWPIAGLDEETLVKLNCPSSHMPFFQKHVFFFRAMRILSRFRKDWMTCVVNTLIPAKTFKEDSFGVFFPKAKSTPMATATISDFEDSDVGNAPTGKTKEKKAEKKPKELCKKEAEKKAAREKAAQEKLRQDQAEKRREAAELKTMREEEKHQRDLERIIQEQAEKERRMLERKAREAEKKAKKRKQKEERKVRLKIAYSPYPYPYFGPLTHLAPEIFVRIPQDVYASLPFMPKKPTHSKRITEYLDEITKNETLTRQEKAKEILSLLRTITPIKNSLDWKLIISLMKDPKYAFTKEELGFTEEDLEITE